MAEANDISSMIYQNLIDAGCDKQTTEQCMVAVKKGNYLEMLPILSRHRANLLALVRSEQKQMDCLDYLIFKIQEAVQ